MGTVQAWLPFPSQTPKGVLPPPLLFCPSTPWTPPKTKASLWSWPTGLMPAAFFACFLSKIPAPAPWSAPPPPAQLLGGSEQSPVFCPAWGPLTAPMPPINRSGPRRKNPGSSATRPVEIPSIQALADLGLVPLNLDTLIFKTGEKNSHPMGLSGRLNVSETPRSCLPHSGGTV